MMTDLSRNQTIAASMADIAQELLASLDAHDKAKLTWDFDEAERRTWFYTPTDHGGLAMSEMDSVKQRIVWRLVAEALSTAGYNTTAAIVGLENILDHVEGFGVDWGRPRGRDPLLYWIAVFGTPGGHGRWGWRFGGHHVSINFTISNGTIIGATPCFLGADPASSPLLGPHLLRPLGAVEDLGRELARSLDPTQAQSGIASTNAPPDLIGVNRTVLAEGDNTIGLPYLWRGRFEAAIDELLGTLQRRLEDSLGTTPDRLAELDFSAKPKGIAGSSMTAEQKSMMRELLTTYVGRIADDLADTQMAKVDRDLDQLHFLWAGGLDPMTPHYYRIQGGDLFVEYDNAQRGGNHVHTVWRDLSTDFGGDPLAAHYLGAPKGHHH